MRQKGKILIKSNKKRRIGTISCIIFCVLIWSGLRVTSQKQLITVFGERSPQSTRNQSRATKIIVNGISIIKMLFGGIFEKVFLIFFRQFFQKRK